MIQTGKITKKEQNEMVMDLEKLIYDHNVFSEIQRVFTTDKIANGFYEVARKSIMGKFSEESAYAFAIKNMAYTIATKGYPSHQQKIQLGFLN